MVPVAGAVEFVGAGFDGDIDGCAAGHALFGVEGVGDEVDGFDGFGGRDVGDDVREPGVAYCRAIEAGVVVGIGRAVDVGAEGALGVSGVGVEFGGRRKGFFAVSCG